MMEYNKDIIFIYKFDSREPNVKYGKIRLSKIEEPQLIHHIKPIIIDVINNSGKTWLIEYWDINISIISVIDRDECLINDMNEEMSLYSIYIDLINDEKSKYYYEGEPVII